MPNTDNKIKHVTCKVCGVLAVPHEHPRVDGTYDSKPSADGRWWDDKKYVDIRDPDNIDWDIPAIIAEAVERERDEVYFGEHGKHRRSAN